MSEPKHCTGFGRVEGACGQPIDFEALGLNPSGLFCVNCELNRREHIDRRMKEIDAKFAANKGEAGA